MSARLFTNITDDPSTYATTVADIANGIDCVSRGQFPPDAVIAMALHIAENHLTRSGGGDVTAVACVVEDDGDPAPHVTIQPQSLN
jgi:hypothetical protein